MVDFRTKDRIFTLRLSNVTIPILNFFIVDSMEILYKVNASLPKSVSGKLSQNFVNISLPMGNSTSNPCLGKSACQISLIILDQPVNTFISNSKESTLKSILIDMSIQAAEIVSPNNQVVIKDLSVTGLNQTINITIPLLSPLNTTNPNKTLGCGYIDESDQIFKTEGISSNQISNTLVTCKCEHLTAIGVEEYTGDGNVDTEVPDNGGTYNDSEDLEAKTSNLSASWAIYVAIILLIVLGLGILWAYWKDRKDELIYDRLKTDKKKIYVNVYL